MSAAAGLSKVTDTDLKRLLKALHNDVLRSPITRAGLIEAAFGHIEEHLDVIVGRDSSAARALVVAVLAERTQRRTGESELAHSGPAVPGTRSRDTRERVRDAIARAEQSVLLFGVRGAEDESLLQMLIAVAEPKHLDVTLVLESPLREHLELPETWRVYCTVPPLTLHSRAAIVDRSSMLLTSDCLSGREDDDHLHLGARIDDQSIVAQLLEELERLVKSGRIVGRAT